MLIVRIAVVLLLCATGIANAQAQTVLHVEVRSADGPVAGAAVVVNGTKYTTNEAGTVTIPVSPGRVSIAARSAGFTEAACAHRQPGRDIHIVLHEPLGSIVTASTGRS